jgi:hypothetical protein
MGLTRRTAIVVALVATALALATLVQLASADDALVRSRADLPSVAFGKPFDWLVQDQRGLGPPLPARVSLESPREVSTTLEPGGFLVDLALCWLVWSAAIVALLDGCQRMRRLAHGGAYL